VLTVEGLAEVEASTKESDILTVEILAVVEAAAKAESYPEAATNESAYPEHPKAPIQQIRRRFVAAHNDQTISYDSDFANVFHPFVYRTSCKSANHLLDG